MPISDTWYFQIQPSDSACEPKYNQRHWENTMYERISIYPTGAHSETEQSESAEIKKWRLAVFIPSKWFLHRPI